MGTMKKFIVQIICFILGIIMCGSVLQYEINGLLGFSLATLDVFFLVISLTLKGLIHLFLP